MIQQKIIHEFIQTHDTGWIEADRSSIRQDFAENKPNITVSLSDAIQELCIKASQQQTAGQKGPAAYICITMLCTNLLENNWSYRIDLYDTNFYLDKSECAINWTCTPVWDYFASRLAALQTAAQTGIYSGKIQMYHINKIKLSNAKHYHQEAQHLLKNIITQALQTPAYIALAKASNLKILIGEYMDQLHILHKET